MAYSKKAVVKHLHGDIKGFKKDAQEDRELLKKLKDPRDKKRDHKKKEPKKRDPKTKLAESTKTSESPKFEKVMHEWKTDKLHSGSKKGPKVKSQKEALAIAFSEARRNKGK